MDPQCIRKAANLSKQIDAYRWESKSQWDPSIVRETIPIVSPKLVTLVQKIKDLDRKDQELHQQTFKHVIISTMKPTTYGVKAVIAALLAYELIPSADPLLTSSDIDGKPQSIRTQRRIIQNFNMRPSPDNLRILTIDGSFQEGLDLFDVKYMHIMEPLTLFEQKQAIGRGTRFCGQIGLPRNPETNNWDLYVFIYEMTYQSPDPVTISDLLKMADPKAADLSRQFDAADRLCRRAAIDRQLVNPPTAAPVSAPNQSGGRKMVLGSRYVPKADILQLPYDQLQSWIYDRFKNLRGANRAVWTSSISASTCGKPSESTTLNPTQNFLRLYYTPENSYKGMLLYHSVGSGKTCSAVSTMASFVKKGYSVLWVTRHTLKKEMLKNIFDTVCYPPFRRTKKILREVRGEKEDTDAQTRRLAESNILPPISYRQFTNFLKGRNKALRELLEKRNGSADPLSKTLLIVDEAHRLVDQSLPEPERPDPIAFHKSLQQSYATSGPDSVRTLLLSATPFRRSPHDLVSLLNLIGTEEQQIPLDLPMDQIHPDAVKGRISYLDRSKDTDHFAQPIIETILVPASTPRLKDTPAMKEIKAEMLSKTNAYRDLYKEAIGRILQEEQRVQALLKQVVSTTGDWSRPEVQEEARRQRSLILAELNAYSGTIYQYLEKKKQNLMDELASLERKYAREVQRLEKNSYNDPSAAAAIRRCFAPTAPQTKI